MMKIGKKTLYQIGIAAASIWVFMLVTLIIRRWQRSRSPTGASEAVEHSRVDGIYQQIQGLSEDQVTSLSPSSDQALENQIRQRKFKREAISQNIFTVFNINLFAMMVVNLLLDNPIGVILSLIVLTISLSLRVFQIMFTKRHMDEIVRSLRPRASVIRSGQLQSISPAKIVPGDYITFGDGDEILVDGTLAGNRDVTIEQVNTSGQANREIKKPGDALHAGSYCVKGRGVFISKEGGWHRYQTEGSYQLKLMHSERTPLQRLTEYFLRILLGIVLFFAVLLVVDAVFVKTSLSNAVYRNAFAIVFGVAPTGLFFVLIFKNIIGVFRISRRGGLVYDPQSIETLAQVKTICISKESLVSGLQVNMDLIESSDGQEPLAENIIRQILGDMVHSYFSFSPKLQMLANVLPGEQRRVKEVVPFLDRFGWFGITFEDADRQGTYILGEQRVLANYLKKEKVAIGERVESAVSDARQGIGRFLRRFNPKDQEKENLNNTAAITDSSKQPDTESDKQNSAQDESKSDRGQQFRSNLLRLLSPIEELQESHVEQTEQPEDESLVVFTYLPNQESLYDREGTPTLPKDLIPLTYLRINEVIRPEARETLKSLFEEGMQIKILAADQPEKVSLIARDLGVPDEKISMVSGVDLNNRPDLTETMRETLIFGSLTPSGKAEIVKSLRAQDAFVLMIGSAVSDIPALKQAYLSVVPKSGAQAALQLSDIVLLDESIAVLPQIFTEGQRMINGVLVTFKLYLSQVIMQLLLILLIFFNILGQFPYHSTHAGVTSVFTITIPNIFLVVWASAGRLTIDSIKRQLTRFVIPVALALTLLVSGIFVIFNERSGDAAYARMAVAYVLLLAGWVRVFFVQPPNEFWAGGTPLRGDLRVYRVVIGSALFLTGFLLFPFFRESFKITLLSSWADFLTVILAVVAWTLSLKIIWWLSKKW